MSVTNGYCCTEFREVDLSDAVFALERVGSGKDWASCIATMDGDLFSIDVAIVCDVLPLARLNEINLCVCVLAVAVQNACAVSGLAEYLISEFTSSVVRSAGSGKSRTCCFVDLSLVDLSFVYFPVVGLSVIDLSFVNSSLVNWNIVHVYRACHFRLFGEVSLLKWPFPAFYVTDHIQGDGALKVCLPSRVTGSSLSFIGLIPL
jgi:hypothetical protein